MLVIFQEDVCTNTLLLSATGGPAPHNLQVAGDLESATLSAVVPVFDTVSSHAGNVQVNLTFQGTAAAQFLHSKETFVDKELGIRIMSQSVSFTAQATATGTVFGFGQNFTPEASDEATIQSQNDGGLTIQKGL